MACEDAPDLARVFRFCVPNLKILKRNSLAVEHPEDIVVRLHQQRRGVGKRLISGKPTRLSVSVRAENRQVLYLLVKRSGYLAHSGFGGNRRSS